MKPAKETYKRPRAGERITRMSRESWEQREDSISRLRTLMGGVE